MSVMLDDLSIKDTVCQEGLSRVAVACSEWRAQDADMEMVDQPNRLREWRTKRGWSLKKLGAEVGLSYGQVGKLERGDEDLSLARLRQFAKVLNCSPVDLLHPADCEPILAQMRPPRNGGPAFERFDPNGVTPLAWPIRLRRDGGEAFTPRGCVWFGYEFLSHLQLNPTQCEVIDIHDSSMEPAFTEGGSCLVDLQRRKREPEAVYCIEHGGTLLVRRALKKGRRWCLVADNPQGESDVIPWDATLNLIGRVVWAARITVS